MLEPYQEGADPFLVAYDGFESRLYVDTDTGHATFRPEPPPELLDRFYNGAYARPDALSVEREFGLHVVAYAGRLTAKVKSFTGFGDTFAVHDVGTGYGRLVWALNEIGHRATGNEPARHEVEAGLAYTRGTVFPTTLDEALKRLDHPIDLFTAFHVLEHMPDPVRDLSLMREHLSPEGVVLARVPNGHSLQAYLGGRRADPCFHFPGHLQYFTPKSMLKAMRDAGLEPMIMTTRPIEYIEGGRPAVERLLGAPSSLMPAPEAWTEACNANLLGYELLVVAALPDNRTARREAGLDLRADMAFRAFQQRRELNTLGPTTSVGASAGESASPGAGQADSSDTKGRPELVQRIRRILARKRRSSAAGR